MSGPYQVTLDPEHARELATRGATLVLLDVPEGTAVGVDHHTFLVGPQFKGIKMIPPGVHAISYAAGSRNGSYGPTTAFFITLRGAHVAAWRWNSADEVLHIISDEGELAGIESAVKGFHFDQHLAPYNLAAYPQWQELAGKITSRVLEKVAPVGGNINILAEGPSGAGREGSSSAGVGAAPTPAEKALEERLRLGREERAAVHVENAVQEISLNSADIKKEDTVGGGGGAEGTLPPKQQEPQMAAEHAGRCFFTPLPHLIKRSGLSPAELTALNLDKSGVLEELLVEKYQGSEDYFLGEFQYAFLAFLLGHSLEGFYQWKAFLRLLFGCEDAPLGNRASLYTQFLKIFHSQLVHSLAPGCAPDEQAAPLGAPMVDELLQDSFLRKLCTGWLRWIASEGSAVPGEVSDAAGRVGALLQRTLQWECGPVLALYAGESDGDDDEGPVVVEGVEIDDVERM